MKKIFGYCRVSTTRHQQTKRQERNILQAYPDAYIVKESYTGTTTNRPEWNKLYKLVTAEAAKSNQVTIVFDSVSRMSRNAEEGFKLYQELFNTGISLVFLKEPHINTETYKKTINLDIKMTDTNVDILLKAVKEYLMELAKEQIRIAFKQSEKEVEDLHKRISEGLREAQLAGKRIGMPKGSQYTTKKEIAARDIILKHSKDFEGTLEDKDVIKLCGVSRNSYYLYKRNIKEQLNQTL